MLFGEYIHLLRKFVEDNPESIHKEVVTSGDDEGNFFNRVHYAPSLGILDEDDEFTTASDSSKANCVCLN